MFKRYTTRSKIVLVSLLTILLITISIVIIIKPYYFYKHPLKLFGYVAYDTVSYDDYVYTTTNEGFHISKHQEDGKITDDYLFKTNGVCFGINIVEGDLFVGFEDGNLVKYNIGDPTDIEEITRTSLTGAILGISSNDNTLYVSTSVGYIYAISISDLSILDSYRIGSEYIRDIIIYENYLFYASTNSGVGILDITDPENLVSTRRLSGTTGSFDINVFENKLFISRHQYGLVVFEITDDFRLTLLQSIDVSGEIYSSAFDGTHLIIGDLQEGIEKWIYNEETNEFEYLDTFEKAVPHYLYIYDGLIVNADQDRGLFIIPVDFE